MDEERIENLIGVIEQSANSIRFAVVSTKNGSIVAQHNVHVPCQHSQDGWLEQNPDHLFRSILEAFEIVYGNLYENQTETRVKCMTITTQRSTFIVWDKYTGDPLTNVILWLDNRSKDLIQSLNIQIDSNELKIKTGLPLLHYFMASKLLWLFKNDEKIQFANRQNRLMIGTIDSWLLWKLTGMHSTDVTNASATFLMNLEIVDWDHELCRLFKVQKSSLPIIHPSSYTFGEIKIEPFRGVPITGMIADQQAELFGQQCLDLGDTKITFDDTCFVQQNIGPGPYREILSRIPVKSRQKLISTIAYQLSDQQPIHYALEGSLTIAFDWLRYNLGLIGDFDEIDSLSSEENRGVYFVPAIHGLDAPYWDPNASGTIIGLSQFSRKSHLIRATLESVAHQTSDILDYMIEAESSKLIVNGKLSNINLLCQLLADISNKTIIRPDFASISLRLIGAAMLASQAFNVNIVFQQETQDAEIFKPKITNLQREKMKESWRLAVNRSRQWINKKNFAQLQLQQKRWSMIPLVSFTMITFALLIYSQSKN